MSNGDDDPKAEGAGSDDNNGGARKSKAKTGGRRRRAVRPQTVEGRAKDVSDAQATATTATDEGEAAKPAEAQSSSGAKAGRPPAGEAVGDAEKTEPPETEASGEPGSAETGAAADAEAGDAVSASDEQTSAQEETGSAGTQDDDADRPDDDAAEAASAQAPMPTARRASLIGAGLVGALIALGIYLGLYYGGILPRDQSTMMDSLWAQSQELGRRLATLESGAARNAKRDLAKEVSQIQTALEELGSDPKNRLIKRVRRLESSVGTVSGNGQDGAGGGDLASRVSALESGAAKSGQPASDETRSQIAELTKRVQTLELRPAVAGEDGKPVDSSAPIAALSDRIAALDKQLQDVSKQVADLAKSGGVAAQQELTKFESELAALRTELDKLGGTVAKSTSSVDDKLASLRKTLTERDSSAVREVARTTAGALALTNLMKAADSGEAYSAELDVVRPLVDDKSDLAVLDDYAKTGVPNLQTLISQFDSVANDILAAGGSSRDGIVGTLLTSARSLVRVRPVGQVEGEDRGAIVARIEAALQAGDFKTAESEWSSLDGPARNVSKSWAADLKARTAVNDALAGLSDTLTASLTGEAAAAPAKSRTGTNQATDTSASEPDGTDEGTANSTAKSPKKTNSSEPATN